MAVMGDSTRFLKREFGVQVVGDIVYGQAKNSAGHLETLKLDLYLPAGGTGLRPAILWFHGGGFRPGNDKRQIYIPMFANAFAARGYVGIAPDYRLQADPMPDWKAAVRDAADDARMALDWVRDNSGGYAIDPRRLALAGGSAGGMTVINLVYDESAPIDVKQDGVFAVLDMWGTPASHTRLFATVNRHSPPMLLIHGTADALVPYRNSVDLAEELTQAGVDNTLLTLRDAPHTPLAHFEEIVQTMAEFLVKHMPPGSGPGPS